MRCESDNIEELRYDSVYYRIFQERVDEWLKKKGLINRRVISLKKVGRFTIAKRYREPLRRGSDGELMITYSLVKGWPLREGPLP